MQPPIVHRRPPATRSRAAFPLTLALAIAACDPGADTDIPDDTAAASEATTSEPKRPITAAPRAAPPPRPLLWSANLESYLPFTILNRTSHAGSLTNEKFLDWPTSSLRLTAIGVLPGSAFTSPRVLLADGLLPGADPSPPLSFGAFDGTTVAPLGGGNGSDVLVLGFDAWFERLTGAGATAAISLTATTGAQEQLAGLIFPTSRLLHVTVVANRSGRPARLPDFDGDGEVDADESLPPDHAIAYYRGADGSYGIARASATAPAAQPIDPLLYTRISWHLSHGDISLALYDDFLLAHDTRTTVGNRSVLELMPQNLAPPPDPIDPPDAPAEREIEYSDQIEVFAPVLSNEQSMALRNGFRWDATTAWPEGTAERPALFYAMLYVTDPEQRAILDEAEVHWDALPLFSGELAAYDGRVGMFEHDPDDLGGHWVYALLPGAVFNVIREEALIGDEVFAAIVRRDVPEAGATEADGSLRYTWLGAQGIGYAPAPVIDPAAPAPDPILKPHYDDAEEAEPTARRAGPTSKRLGRRLRRAIKKVVDKAKEVVNDVREGVSDVIEAVAPEVTLDIQLTVLNSDGDFDTSQPMVRGWEPDIGQPLSLPGIEVRVRQGKVLLNRPKLNRDGHARVKVIKGLKTDICLTMNNHAAEITTFLIENRVCDFSGSNLGRVRGDRDVHLKVRNGRVHVLAQLTDAYEYMERVEGKRLHKATVLVGKLADRFNGGASYAPCFDFFNARLAGEGVVTDIGVVTIDGALSAFGVPPIAGPLVWAAELVTGVDIILLNDDLSSRGVATHEYGHFVFCSLMYSESLRLFSNVNAEIINKTAAGGRGAGHDVLAINEGFADFITSQVVGGFNYWSAPSSTGRQGEGIWYCDPSSSSCAEDNVGGTVGTEQATPKDGASRLNQTLNFKAAQVMTYMADVVDGDTHSGDYPNDGAAFEYRSGRFRADASGGSHASDEPVALGRGWLRKLVKKLADRRHAAGVTWRLNRGEFFKGLNDLVLAASDRRKACNLCELHLDRQFCDAAGFSTFTCTTFRLTTSVTGVGTVTTSNGGRVSPNPVSCTATGGVCTADYEKDQQVTVRATPGTGQRFAGWGGACSGTSATCSVPMSAAKSVSARFEGAPVMVTLTVVASNGPASSGTITSTPTGINCRNGSQGTCTLTVQAGTRVTLRGSNGDSDWMSWRPVCTGSHSYSCAFEVLANTTVTGIFESLL
jgi:hypothetical protein